MNDIEKLDYRPFTRFCMSIGAVPSSYLAGLTIEEQLLWLCSYLEKEVIPVVNNNSEVVEELKNFVEHYFDNLDVQEEINTKLDEMAESGELQNILLNYTTIEKTYNTYDEMISDFTDNPDNMITGMRVNTVGYHSINDGGNSKYYVATSNDIQGYTITLNEKYLIMIDEENICLKQFGAYGDGVHDDTAELQTAINYLKSLETESKVLNINEGTYLISESISLPIYVKLASLGAVKIKYTGTGEFLHIYNDSAIYEHTVDLMQNAYNLGNILDGSKGVIIIQGSGINENQTGLKIGEDVMQTIHVTTSAWFNITNVYIEKFSKGIFFTKAQNYMQRFYNVAISNCNIAISNSAETPQNSGELITFNACSILNSEIGVQINNIINLSFVNSSIDYNKEGIILNYGGYYELNLLNCWLEGNNRTLNNYLIKSNATQTQLTTVNVKNCYIFPYNRTPATQFSGRMFLNLQGNTLQCNRYTQGNYAEGEFICDSNVTINSFDGFNFVDNTMISSSTQHINTNADFSSGTVGNTSVEGFTFVAGAGSSTVTLSDTRSYSGGKSLQVASNGTYKGIKINAFDVTKYKKIIGDILIYLPDLNGGSNGLNMSTTLKFYDENGTEISGATVTSTQNFNYTVDKLNRWFSIPQGINKSNKYIDVPFNAKTCDFQINFGNIRTTFFIDNMTITGI